MNGKSKTSSPRSFRSLGVLAAMVVAIAAESVVAGEAVEWTEMYVPYNLDGSYGDAESFSKSFLDQNRDAIYTFDDPKRQHLHLYQNPSDKPSPVFFFSHHGGGHANSLSRSLDEIAATGYSVISWESATYLKNQQHIKTCWSDFDLVWSWFQDNAASYNFDPDFVVIGGQSRGTMCSWIMAQSDKPAIKGIFMSEVLPDPSWLPDSKHGSSTYWEEAVSTNSPEALLLFAQECPKPIGQDCVTSPNPGNMHNPRHGQTIVDRYTELGIESRIQLIDGLSNKGIEKYDLFPEFVTSLSSVPQGKSSSSSDAQGQPVSRNFFIEVFISFAMSVCLYVIVATFGYNHYQKLQSDLNEKQKLTVEDPTECAKLVMDDGELSLEDMGKTSYQDEADQLPDIT